MLIIDLTRDPNAEIPRPTPTTADPGEVRAIIDRVKKDGDQALIDLTRELDGVGLGLGELIVTASEIDRAASAAPRELIEALEEAERRIRKFAQGQLMMPWRDEIEGGTVGETMHGVSRAGIYVPGGRAAYPSTVLMCAVPASVAGVGQIAMCVPPGPDGSVMGATLAAAAVAGVDEVYRVGGAQAIAALAFGTETIPSCDVVAGPGNRWVAGAKREVAGYVGIDLVAGPSEIAVLADSSADPEIIAIDLISQAEHGPGGVFAVFTPDSSIAEAVDQALERQLVSAPESLKEAIEEGTVLVLVESLEAGLNAIASLAPEHLEILTEDPESLVDSVRNVGAVFAGVNSPVALGDYMAGSNHVLPTGGAARWSSGLRASHFQRATSVIWYDEGSLETARPHVEVLAEAEGLPRHSRAIQARRTRDD